MSGQAMFSAGNKTCWYGTMLTSKRSTETTVVSDPTHPLSATGTRSSSDSPARADAGNTTSPVSTLPTRRALWPTRNGCSGSGKLRLRPSTPVGEALQPRSNAVRLLAKSRRIGTVLEKDCNACRTYQATVAASVAGCDLSSRVENRRRGRAPNERNWVLLHGDRTKGAPDYNTLVAVSAATRVSWHVRRCSLPIAAERQADPVQLPDQSDSGDSARTAGPY